MTARMDRLIVLAPTLEEGVAHVERALGVEVGPGGEHPGITVPADGRRVLDGAAPALIPAARSS